MFHFISEPPGKVSDLMLTDSTYTTFVLSWTKPKEKKGVEDEAEGYYVEIRPTESLEWTRCNTIPTIRTSYTVLGLKAMATYWVRVIATNYGGEGDALGFDKWITAMPPPGKNLFKFKSGILQEVQSLENWGLTLVQNCRWLMYMYISL